MKTILLIEDNHEIRDKTSALLKPYNNVIIAKNGDEAVSLAEQGKPDMIICDALSKMFDGHYVMEILSKNAKTACIPFLLMNTKKRQLRGLYYNDEENIVKENR